MSYMSSVGCIIVRQDVVVSRFNMNLYNIIMELDVKCLPYECCFIWTVIKYRKE